jgi:hypothetical protein
MAKDLESDLNLLQSRVDGLVEAIKEIAPGPTIARAVDASAKKAAEQAAEQAVNEAAGKNIEILSVLVGFFTFASISFQLFQNAELTTIKAAGFMIVVAGCISFFVSLISLIVKNVSRGKMRKIVPPAIFLVLSVFLVVYGIHILT